MSNVLLIDFGSTYTKLTAVNLEQAVVLGSSTAHTTVTTDLNDGLMIAREKLKAITGDIVYEEQLACSSAAGGLRMAVSGLVPELTAEAARSAALGAGAKVVKLYSHELTNSDLAEILTIDPEIFLLTGGTDGGNRKVILYNAGRLAASGLKCPIIYAGNRAAADEAAELLRGHDLTICPNVMPKLGELNIAPVQEQIRRLFLARIVQAKGLSKIEQLISGIMMPTPQAMLKAMTLLATGTEHEAGIGDLMAIDLGGATTDIYSIADGSPTAASTIIKGLPEPYAKRTVEGDIGMRYGLSGIVDEVGIARLSELSQLDRAEFEYWCQACHDDPSLLPLQQQVRAFDFALAGMAVKIATGRHAGKLEEFYTPLGVAYAQTGKDLRNVRTIVATGGSLIYAPGLKEILTFALYDPQEPGSLRPERANFLVDRKYLLSAMGVLSEKDPNTALRIMKKELIDERSHSQKT
jgi:uncharacterized protein (TIGR01319 family)